MRIARVLHVSSPLPIVALERDGALYGVAELDRIFATKYAPDVLADAADFHTRVIALSCAGLAELDDRLLSGDRPTDARLPPHSFLWLAPCATERAAYIQMAPPEDEPAYWIGNARGLLGHDSGVPFPFREDEPDFELSVAAILRDDLRRATHHEAQRAILGYTILNGWTARSEERRRRSAGFGVTRAVDFAPQLGPVLVTADEIGDTRALRAQARIGSDVLRCSPIGAWRFDLAESIAYASDHIELRAGDIIGASRVSGGSAEDHGRALSYGSTVELTIERIGKLVGRPMRGPEPVEWRGPQGALST
jgi:2-keto-4-pentenoate hydratase/2-oxohepta-3-ene-1,7-dioic acid hydratase in catechol pathway